MPSRKQTPKRSSDIQVEILFDGQPSFPARLLSTVLNLVERAIYEVERSELNTYRVEFPELSDVIFDAAQYRIQRYEGRSLNMSSAVSGSILLGGSAVALALWLLDKTAGETVKEAWKQSKSHRRLVDLLSKPERQKEKAAKIAEQIRLPSYEASIAEVDAGIEERGTTIFVQVLVTPAEQSYPLPTLGAILHGPGKE